MTTKSPNCVQTKALPVRDISLDDDSVIIECIKPSASKDESDRKVLLATSCNEPPELTPYSEEVCISNANRDDSSPPHLLPEGIVFENKANDVFSDNCVTHSASTDTGMASERKVSDVVCIELDDSGEFGDSLSVRNFNSNESHSKADIIPDRRQSTEMGSRFKLKSSYSYSVKKFKTKLKERDKLRKARERMMRCPRTLTMEVVDLEESSSSSASYIPKENLHCNEVTISPCCRCSTQNGNVCLCLSQQVVSDSSTSKIGGIVACQSLIKKSSVSSDFESSTLESVNEDNIGTKSRLKEIVDTRISKTDEKTSCTSEKFFPGQHYLRKEMLAPFSVQSNKNSSPFSLAHKLMLDNINREKSSALMKMSRRKEDNENGRVGENIKNVGRLHTSMENAAGSIKSRDVSITESPETAVSSFNNVGKTSVDIKQDQQRTVMKRLFQDMGDNMSELSREKISSTKLSDEAGNFNTDIVDDCSASSNEDNLKIAKNKKLYSSDKCISFTNEKVMISPTKDKQDVEMDHSFSSNDGDVSCVKVVDVRTIVESDVDEVDILELKDNVNHISEMEEEEKNESQNSYVANNRKHETKAFLSKLYTGMVEASSSGNTTDVLHDFNGSHGSRMLVDSFGRDLLAGCDIVQGAATSLNIPCASDSNKYLSFDLDNWHEMEGEDEEDDDYFTLPQRVSTGKEERDVIDGIEILSFETERDMVEFTKIQHDFWHGSSIDDGLIQSDDGLDMMDDTYAFSGDMEIHCVQQGIVPKKTNDITKIKGWRNKHFAVNDNLIHYSESNGTFEDDDGFESCDVKTTDEANMEEEQQMQWCSDDTKHTDTEDGLNKGESSPLSEEKTSCKLPTFSGSSKNKTSPVKDDSSFSGSPKNKTSPVKDDSSFSGSPKNKTSPVKDDSSLNSAALFKPEAVELLKRLESNVSETKNTKSAFVSDVLDDYLSVHAQLNVSYEIPKLGAEEGIMHHSDELEQFRFPSPQKSTQTNSTLERPLVPKKTGPKPKTLAEKRKMLEQEMLEAKGNNKHQQQPPRKRGRPRIHPLVPKKSPPSVKFVKVANVVESNPTLKSPSLPEVKDIHEEKLKEMSLDPEYKYTWIGERPIRITGSKLNKEPFCEPIVPSYFAQPDKVQEKTASNVDEEPPTSHIETEKSSAETREEEQTIDSSTPHDLQPAEEVEKMESEDVADEFGMVVSTGAGHPLHPLAIKQLFLIRKDQYNIDNIWAKFSTSAVTSRSNIGKTQMTEKVIIPIKNNALSPNEDIILKIDFQQNASQLNKSEKTEAQFQGEKEGNLKNKPEETEIQYKVGNKLSKDERAKKSDMNISRPFTVIKLPKRVSPRPMRTRSSTRTIQGTSPLPVKISDAKFMPVSPIDNINVEVKKVMNDMLQCLSRHDIENSIIKDDPDTVTLPATNNKYYKKSISKQMKNKVFRELTRLDVNVILMREDEEGYMEKVRGGGNCERDFCRLGCVCSSIENCKPVSMYSDHCDKAACIFECLCPAKESSQQNNSAEEKPSLFFNTAKILQEEGNRHLAKVEKEFRQTVVQAKDKTIVLGGGSSGDGGRRRREIKLPERYKDSVLGKEFAIAELKMIAGEDIISPSTGVQGSKRSERQFHLPSYVGVGIPKPAPQLKSHSKPLKPLKAKLTQQQKMSLLRERYRVKSCKVLVEKTQGLEGVVPWCMIHLRYDCFCSGQSVKPFKRMTYRPIARPPPIPGPPLEVSNKGQELPHRRRQVAIKSTAGLHIHGHDVDNHSARTYGTTINYLLRNRSHFFERKQQMGFDHLDPLLISNEEYESQLRALQLENGEPTGFILPSGEYMSFYDGQPMDPMNFGVAENTEDEVGFGKIVSITSLKPEEFEGFVTGSEVSITSLKPEESERFVTANEMHSGNERNQDKNLHNGKETFSKASIQQADSLQELQSKNNEESSSGISDVTTSEQSDSKSKNNQEENNSSEKLEKPSNTVNQGIPVLSKVSDDTRSQKSQEETHQRGTVEKPSVSEAQNLLEGRHINSEKKQEAQSESAKFEKPLMTLIPILPEISNDVNSVRLAALISKKDAELRKILENYIMPLNLSHNVTGSIQLVKWCNLLNYWKNGKYHIWLQYRRGSLVKLLVTGSATKPDQYCINLEDYQSESPPDFYNKLPSLIISLIEQLFPKIPKNDRTLAVIARELNSFGLLQYDGENWELVGSLLRNVKRYTIQGVQNLCIDPHGENRRLQNLEKISQQKLTNTVEKNKSSEVPEKKSNIDEIVNKDNVSFGELPISSVTNTLQNSQSLENEALTIVDNTATVTEENLQSHENKTLPISDNSATITDDNSQSHENKTLSITENSATVTDQNSESQENKTLSLSDNTATSTDQNSQPCVNKTLSSDNTATSTDHNTQSHENKTLPITENSATITDQNSESQENKTLSSDNTATSTDQNSQSRENETLPLSDNAATSTDQNSQTPENETLSISDNIDGNSQSTLPDQSAIQNSESDKNEVMATNRQQNSQSRENQSMIKNNSSVLEKSLHCESVGMCMNYPLEPELAKVHDSIALRSEVINDKNNDTEKDDGENAVKNDIDENNDKKIDGSDAIKINVDDSNKTNDGGAKTDDNEVIKTDSMIDDKAVISSSVISEICTRSTLPNEDNRSNQNDNRYTTEEEILSLSQPLESKEKSLANETLSLEHSILCESTGLLIDSEKSLEPKLLKTKNSASDSDESDNSKSTDAKVSNLTHNVEKLSSNDIESLTTKYRSAINAIMAMRGDVKSKTTAETENNVTCISEQMSKSSTKLNNQDNTVNPDDLKKTVALLEKSSVVLPEGIERLIKLRSESGYGKDILSRDSSSNCFSTDNNVLYSKSHFLSSGIEVPLPTGSEPARWYMLNVRNRFDLLHLQECKCIIRYPQLVRAIMLSNAHLKTVRVPLEKRPSKNSHTPGTSQPKFGVYTVPRLFTRVFIGPYNLREEAGVNAIKVVNGKLVNTMYCDSSNEKVEVDQVLVPLLLPGTKEAAMNAKMEQLYDSIAHVPKDNKNCRGMWLYTTRIAEKSNKAGTSQSSVVSFRDESRISSSNSFNLAEQCVKTPNVETKVTSNTKKTRHEEPSAAVEESENVCTVPVVESQVKMMDTDKTQHEEPGAALENTKKIQHEEPSTAVEENENVSTVPDVETQVTMTDTKKIQGEEPGPSVENAKHEKPGTTVKKNKNVSTVPAVETQVTMMDTKKMKSEEPGAAVEKNENISTVLDVETQATMTDTKKIQHEEPSTAAENTKKTQHDEPSTAVENTKETQLEESRAAVERNENVSTVPDVETQVAMMDTKKTQQEEPGAAVEKNENVSTVESQVTEKTQREEPSAAVEKSGNVSTVLPSKECSSTVENGNVISIPLQSEKPTSAAKIENSSVPSHSKELTSAVESVNISDVSLQSEGSSSTVENENVEDELLKNEGPNSVEESKSVSAVPLPNKGPISAAENNVSAETLKNEELIRTLRKNVSMSKKFNSALALSSIPKQSEGTISAVLNSSTVPLQTEGLISEVENNVSCVPLQDERVSSAERNSVDTVPSQSESSTAQSNISTIPSHSEENNVSTVPVQSESSAARNSVSTVSSTVENVSTVPLQVEGLSSVCAPSDTEGLKSVVKNVSTVPLQSEGVSSAVENNVSTVLSQSEEPSDYVNIEPASPVDTVESKRFSSRRKQVLQPRILPPAFSVHNNNEPVVVQESNNDLPVPLPSVDSKPDSDDEPLDVVTPCDVGLFRYSHLIKNAVASGRRNSLDMHLKRLSLAKGGAAVSTSLTDGGAVSTSLAEGGAALSTSLAKGGAVVSTSSATSVSSVHKPIPSQSVTKPSHVVSVGKTAVSIKLVPSIPSVGYVKGVMYHNKSVLLEDPFAKHTNNAYFQNLETASKWLTDELRKKMIFGDNIKLKWRVRHATVNTKMCQPLDPKILDGEHILTDKGVFNTETGEAVNYIPVVKEKEKEKEEEKEKQQESSKSSTSSEHANLERARRKEIMDCFKKLGSSFLTEEALSKANKFSILKQAVNEIRKMHVTNIQLQSELAFEKKRRITNFVRFYQKLKALPTHDDKKRELANLKKIFENYGRIPVIQIDDTNDESDDVTELRNVSTSSHGSSRRDREEIRSNESDIRDYMTDDKESEAGSDAVSSDSRNSSILRSSLETKHLKRKAEALQNFEKQQIVIYHFVHQGSGEKDVGRGIGLKLRG